MTAPNSQLLNLQSISRLIMILDKADDCGGICKFQKLDRGIFCSAVVRIQGEEKWRKHTTLGGVSTDVEGPGCAFSQSHLLLPACLETCDPLTDWGGAW